MAKYDALRAELQSGSSSARHMTFATIEALVGDLPASAYEHSAWWANDATHVQARAWLEAGRTVTGLDLTGREVTFSSSSESY
jgi:hypothetical protein